MIGALRRCNDCNYRTIILKDDLEEKHCHRCNGHLEIVMKEKSEVTND